MLRTIALARIPGLLAGGLEETGAAQLITDFEAAPVRFLSDCSGDLSVELRAVRMNAPGEVRAYLQTAAAGCGYDVRALDAYLWVSAHLPQDRRMLDTCRDFCRLMRQIVSAAGWLERDATARACWAALAGRSGAFEKGDSKK